MIAEQPLSALRLELEQIDESIAILKRHMQAGLDPAAQRRAERALPLRMRQRRTLQNKISAWKNRRKSK